MMQQYHDAKAAAGDALLLFRMGDFYELFFEDAKTAARTLGLALTSRDKGDDPVPMAGFPYHQLDSYLAKIIAAGHRAAICEQVEDAKQAKGLVKREVTRIVTPGTLTDECTLDPPRAISSRQSPTPQRRSNFRLPALPGSTSPRAAFPPHPSRRSAADQLAHSSGGAADQRRGFAAVRPTGKRTTALHSLAAPRGPSAHVAAVETLTKHFGTRTLEGFGFNAEPAAADAAALRAAGAILNYLRETQKASLAHIDRLCLIPSTTAGDRPRHAPQPGAHRRCATTAAKAHSSASLDRTVTSLGARLLADWLAAPLTDVAAINARIDAVDELVTDATLTSQLRESLREIYDIQRLLSRVTTGRAARATCPSSDERWLACRK